MKKFRWTHTRRRIFREIERRGYIAKPTNMGDRSALLNLALQGFVCGLHGLPIFDSTQFTWTDAGRALWAAEAGEPKR